MDPRRIQQRPEPTLAAVEAALRAMWKDTHERFSIDARGSTRREVLALLRSEFEGLEIAIRAAEALKKSP
jgi:hypothetical protein